MMEGKKPSVIDDTRQFIVPGNEEETIKYAVEHLIFIAKESIAERGAFYIALSGGSTPKKIFTLLSNPAFKSSLNWEKVFIFWGDERSVPPTDKDSNYKMAFDFGLKILPIPKENIFRMVTEKEIDKNAEAYENLIKQVVPDLSFDLIMLGMGDDGHTASLFPKTKALEVKDRLVVANDVPQKSTKRMTFTYPLIHKAKNVHIYVIGEEKKERVAEVLTDKTKSAPSAKVGTSKHPALWILDQSAASLLLKH